jgi:hypothetical protein
MVLAVYTPVAPATIWSLREIHRQREAAESLDRLRKYVENLWMTTLKGNTTELALDAESREIQDSICEARIRNPLIFNWINGIIRPVQELSMNAKAEELVAEAQASFLAKSIDDKRNN